MVISPLLVVNGLLAATVTGAADRICRLETAIFTLTERG